MPMLAYLDPGSGSMIVQALVAGVAGIAVVAKVGWRRLTMPFTRRRKTESDQSGSEVQAES